jgi:phosphoadenosine phosphosulfate reductase
MPSSLFSRELSRITDIIQRGLLEMRQPYLSCSWGKDSVFLLWCMLRIKPDIPVVYMNSNYAFPETYELRDRLVKEWNLNYIELPAAVDYAEIIQEFGLPDITRTQAQQKRVVDILKKNRANTWSQEHGYDGNFWGIRADESRARLKLIQHKGDLFRSKDGLWRCSPLAHIKIRELWWMIDHYQIPYSHVYDKTLFFPRHQIRNAGWLTTDGAAHGRIAWLKHYYPDKYYLLAAQYPEIRSYT